MRALEKEWTEPLSTPPLFLTTWSPPLRGRDAARGSSRAVLGLRPTGRRRAAYTPARRESISPVRRLRCRFALKCPGPVEEVDNIAFVGLQPVELRRGDGAQVEPVDVFAIEQLSTELGVLGNAAAD